MKKNIIILVILTTSLGVDAQNVGINSTGSVPNASAMLDVASTSKGLLIPNVALTAINLAGPISSPATSLLVYNTATASSGVNAVTPGYYYWDGTQWVRLATNPSGTSTTAWNILGNASTVDGTHFLGTTDNIPLSFRVNNIRAGRLDNSLGSTFYGYNSGLTNTIGSNNTLIGTNTDVSVNNLSNATAIGYNAKVGVSNALVLGATGASSVMVGIGTSTPTELLDVNGPALFRNGNNNNAFTNNQLLFGYGNTNTYRHAIKTRHYSGGRVGNSIDFYVWNQAVDAVGAVGTQQVMTLDGNGFVGVGGTNPKSNLDVYGNIAIGSYAGSTAAPANSAIISGSIGIGTATPAALLDVNGISLFRNGNSANVYTSNQMLFGWNNTNTYMHAIKTRHNTGSKANNSFDFYVWNQGVDAAGTIGTQQVMTLDGNGFVGVGVTSPITKLDLTGIKTTGAGTGTGANSDAPTQAAIPGGDVGVNRKNDWPSGWGGGISTWDICGATAFMNAFNVRSDIKLKKDIKTIDNETAQKLLKIRPVTYLMKEEIPECEGLQYGFIAQEVRELFPSIVTKSSDPNGTIGMNYQALIAPTIYVLQQQVEKVKIQGTEIQELKKELELLKKQNIEILQLLNKKIDNKLK